MSKISIVTATYNAEEYIVGLLESVRGQIDNVFEFIIVDGGSTDRTIEVIMANADIITFWVSEDDQGIYDAWNKGIAFARGEWIMFLGADDRLMPGALKKYINFISTHTHKSQLQLISSKKQMIDKDGKIIRTTGYKWEWPLFQQVMTIAHPGALHAMTLFKEYGVFNISYKICGDFELLLRPKGALKAAFMNEVTVQMSEGGTSDSIAAIFEFYKATTKTGGYGKISAFGTSIFVMLKFLAKKGLRKIGINAYLKK